MRKKTDTAAQPEAQKIKFETPKPGLEFMARFEVNFGAPVLELGPIESVGKRRIILSTDHPRLPRARKASIRSLNSQRIDRAG